MVARIDSSNPTTSETLGTDLGTNPLAEAESPLMGRKATKVVIIVGKKGPPVDDAQAVVPPEAARDSGDGIVVSAVPDVCKTPMGSATPPVPYNIVAKLDEDAKTTPSVRFNRKLKAYTTVSHTTCCHGDEAGVATGVKSGTVGDICEPKTHASKLRAEGNWVIRHGDEFWMNKKNTTGFLTYQGDDGNYWPRQRSKDPETNAEEERLLREALANPNVEVIETDQIKVGRIQVMEVKDERSLVQAVRAYEPNYGKPVQLAQAAIPVPGIPFPIYYKPMTPEEAAQAARSLNRGIDNVRQSIRDNVNRTIIILYVIHGPMVKHLFAPPETAPDLAPGVDDARTRRPIPEPEVLERDSRKRKPHDDPDPGPLPVPIPGPDGRVVGRTRKRENEKCDPEKAEAFKEISRYGQNVVRIDFWARYQVEKCGPQEYNIGKSFGYLKPIADGLCHDQCPDEPGLGCLILEAKFSPAKKQENSLYGYNVSSTQDDPASRISLEGISFYGSDEVKLGDYLEDLDEVDLGKPDDTRWQNRRIASVKQIGLYYAVCADVKIPYWNFVIIYNIGFIKDYYSMLVRLPGYLISKAAPLGGSRKWYN